MCGITGFLNVSQFKTLDEMQTIVNQMSDCIIHRGPDDSGTWVDSREGIALGHRRLSIIDLSSEGRQPMHSFSGRYVITFNGEIYNFKKLRQKLELLGYTFRGYSDTEVMLTAIEEWGLEVALKSFNGMFAFALWDRKERFLHLVRDRLGEKPLYYGQIGNAFVFASELKALRNYPYFKAEVNRDSLALYLRYNCIPAPYSIYKDIFKLLPGTILTLNTRETSLTTPTPYWSAKEVAEDGKLNPFSGTEEEAINQLDKLLRDAIGQQMIADVPLGAFLSGGVDSSAVVALMQVQSLRPVKTFTIGFNETAYNEAEHARRVAKHLGTDHTELYVTPKQTMEVISNLSTLYDEPFSDSSQIPTFLVAGLAKQKVTVSLSGDGGDELFAGYNRYLWAKNVWEKARLIPPSIRQFGANCIRTISPQAWDFVFSNLEPIIPERYKQRLPGDKIYKLAEVFPSKTPEELYQRLVSHWNHPEQVVLDVFEPPTAAYDSDKWAKLEDFTQWTMFLDLISYLPDDILVKVDRACMGVSLESRVPLLDYRLVEFAWKLPISMKIKNGQGKWLLRKVLYQYVPREIIERPKMGFGIPIDSWLRGPLREWAEELLDENRLRKEGFFNPEPIRQKWTEHIMGKRNWQYCLWDILMFQSWLERWRV